MLYADAKYSGYPDYQGGITMVMIEKMDGRRELFIPEKIVVAAMKNGAPPEIARAISQDISKGVREGMSTQDIKVQLLLLLKSKNPEWEQNWFIWRYGNEPTSGLSAPGLRSNDPVSSTGS